MRALLSILIAFVMATITSAAEPIFKADFAEGDITPEIGCEAPGGYETRLTSYSNLETTAGGQMRDAGLELAKRLKAGAVPVPPKPLPFAGQPWSYGNNRPEVK